MVSSDRLSRFDRELVAVLGEILSGVVEIWAYAAIETFLYGAYFIMMVIYIRAIRKRGLARNRLLASATISLFILCTAHCILVFAEAAIAGRFVLRNEAQPTGLSTGQKLSLAANIAYVSANVLADAIFIIRCYAIWSFQKKIIVIPVLLTLGVAGMGYFNALFNAANDDMGIVLPFARQPLFPFTVEMSLVTTFILMGLTVGRIWMLARTARRVLGVELTSKYRTVCAMILESGALYLCGGIAFIVNTPPLTTESQSGVVLAQLVGIAPTIIAVRVALGQSVENVNSFFVPKPGVQEASATALDQWDDEKVEAV